MIKCACRAGMKAWSHSAIGIRTKVIVSVLFGLLATGAMAHPSEEWAEQFRVLALWAESISHGDAEGASELTASGSVPFRGSPATALSVREAIFSEGADGVTASPLVLSTDLGTILSTWSVLLVEEAGAWKVKSMTPGAGSVPGLPNDLPEHSVTQPVSFSLTDAETGRAVYARVRITDSDGNYWPPDGHQKNIRTGWRQDVGGDVQVAGATFAYVAPEFIARLPVGNFSIEVHKGIEYHPAHKDFRVATPGGGTPIGVTMERWINMKARGWHAADTHTHFLDGPTGLLELRAEDLSVLYILATKWSELITDVTRFTGEPSLVSGPDEIVVFNEETRHGWLGHTILHGIHELVYPLTWGGPSEGVAGEFDYPAMAMQADKAHAQGGMVTWAHFPFPGGELAVDMALGKIDTVDLFTWGDAFATNTLPSGQTMPSTVDLWYQFLNTNSRVPATAGTDKMLNVQVAGAVRTYARVGEKATYENWLDALARGETLVSTGPIVTLTANGQPIGSDLKLSAGETVKLEAELHAPYDLYPVDVLEIVMGGEVVASIANEDGESELSVAAAVTVPSSTWVAARANGSTLLPHQKWALLNSPGIPPMAHTSPIYLTVDGAPVWVPLAAAALTRAVDVAINWVTTQGRYRTDAQREEVLTLFEQARDYYANPPLR